MSLFQEPTHKRYLSEKIRDNEKNELMQILSVYQQEDDLYAKCRISPNIQTYFQEFPSLLENVLIKNIIVCQIDPITARFNPVPDMDPRHL